MTPARPIAITMGDPAGVGPELVAQLFVRQPSWSRRCVVLGDSAVLRRAAAITAPDATVIDVHTWDAVATVPPGSIPLMPVAHLARPVAWGRVDPLAGEAAAQCIRAGALAACRHDVAALVTAPIHKEAIHAAGIAFPGHTEWLQALAADHLGCAIEAVPVRMMLSSPSLHTVLVSIHLSLRQAIEAVTHDNVLETIVVTHRHFRNQRGVSAPRIAVAGLNPHAGEGGLFGHEDGQIIAPAVQAARAQGIDASGPWAPDTVFMQARQGRFDVVVAMYHDQGLIPVKYLGIADGVNTTLGLPFVRTSPDHGTAFDLAGTGRADPSSLEAAVRAAFCAPTP